MAVPTPQRTYRQPVNEAIQWLRAHSRQTCVGTATSSSRRFVLLQDVRKYFDYDRLIPILDNILPDGEDSGRLASLILNSEGDRGDAYLLVFLILLHINQGQEIESFLAGDELCDKRLPFRNKEDFPHDVDFEKFCEQQHAFCAPQFRLNNRKKFSSQLILPIVQNTPLDVGESARLSLIELHPQFDYLDTTSESNHLYVLKTFSGSDGKRRFEHEVDGYTQTRKTGLQTHSLLQYYGTYTYCNEYNIILEYADLGTWEQFMETREPPSRSQDIISLWKSLLEVSQALHRIHLASGMHQDIHSKNLLLKSRRPRSTGFDFFIKLADFGRSYFNERKEQGQSVLVKDMYGTKENGAPECYRRTEYTQNTLLKIPQTADVWSLGCIYSESAKWMTEGWLGVQRYRARRLSEVQDLKMEKIAFFHDAAKRLECVDEAHRDIRYNKRHDDPLTSAICPGLLNDMLHDNSTIRLSSLDLVNRVQNILDSATPPQDDDHIPSKLKRNQTEPSTPQRPKQHERRTQSTNAKYSKSVGEYAPMVETPMRNMSLSEPDDVTTSSKARGKRPIGRQSRESWSQQPIVEDEEDEEEEKEEAQREGEAEDEGVADNDEDAQHTFGPMVESPEPAHTRVFGRPPPRKNTSPRASRKFTGRSDSLGTAISSHHSGSDSHDNGVYSKGQLEVPALDLSGALHFMNEKKSGVTDAYLPWGNKLKGKLKRRDHVFLLDNSFSTNPLWESILGTFGLLSFLVEEDDPDGVEVRFTNGAKPKISRSSNELTQYAKGVQARGHTDMEESLGIVLKEYEKKIFLYEEGMDITPVRPLSIYILTDGVWAQGGNPEVPMLSLTEILKRYELTRRQVGIQFITFGHNKERLQHMQNLDDMSQGFGLEKDFVDTEPSTGNIWKMLLGAIDDYFDSINENQSQ